MEENIKVDKDYKKAFNLGYELANELNLKTPMFEDLNVGNDRMSALRSGMVQYSIEIGQVKHNEIDPPNEMQNDKNFKKNDTKDEGKGLDMSM